MKASFTKLSKWIQHYLSISILPPFPFPLKKMQNICLYASIRVHITILCCIVPIYEYTVIVPTFFSPGGELIFCSTCFACSKRGGSNLVNVPLSCPYHQLPVGLGPALYSVFFSGIPWELWSPKGFHIFPLAGVRQVGWSTLCAGCGGT